MAQLRDIAGLTPWPDNYQESDIGKIIVSILTSGYNDTLRIWRDPEQPDRELIMAGNHTHQALIKIAKTGKKILKQLNLEDRPWPPTHIVEQPNEDGTVSWLVDTIDLDHLNYMQAQAYAIADNEIARKSVRDDVALAEHLIKLAEKDRRAFRGTGFDDDDLDFMIKNMGEMFEDEEDSIIKDPGANISKAAELQAKWQTARGQIWQIGSHRLSCGDCTNADDVAALFGDARAEVVWTDPPYGVSIGSKNKWLNAIAPSNRVEENLENDILDEDGLINMLSKAFDLAMRHCLAGGAWYVAAPPGPLHILFGQALKDRGIWRQTIIWVKNNATFSPMGVDYHWRAEPIFYGWLPNAAHRYYGGRKQDTVWEIDRPVASPEHPTMKPVELVVRAIKNSSKHDELVYDPFLGSGTTMVAAEQLGRICYGMEIDPKYVAVILERMADMGLIPELLKPNQSGQMEESDVSQDQ